MRTTLNLDDDIVRQLSDLARKSGRSMSRVTNDALRIGLRGEDAQPLLPYEAPTFDTGTPLLDVTDLADALEQLDGD